MIDTKYIMTYLTDLQQHNHREWFHEHKQDRRKATEEFHKLISQLLLEIHCFDDQIPMLEPKELTFKLVRDTRFSADKSPYNPAFRAHLGPKGKLPIPVGYFLHLQPNGNTIIGGGLFADMFKDATEMIRVAIDKHGEEFHDIVHRPEFANSFTLLGTKLKNVPRNYEKDHPYGEYLKYKSWFIEYHFSDEEVMNSASFLQKTVILCQYMKPFHDFLNRALHDFKMPPR